MDATNIQKERTGHGWPALHYYLRYTFARRISGILGQRKNMQIYFIFVLTVIRRLAYSA